MFSINALLLKTQEMSSPAIYSNSVQLDYEEFRKKVLKTAGILSGMKIIDKANIAIIGNSDVEFIINLLALWQINAVPVLISPRLTDNEIEEQIITSDCKVILQSRLKKSIHLASDIKILSYPFDKLGQRWGHLPTKKKFLRYLTHRLGGFSRTESDFGPRTI